ncbi:hypothetical protein K505DRAFT_365163 [Melanomma pulvis-pyrius CBS 109.77]|uniref:Uncharacterized protein n=1 Tax=Melanomma pulvis-pyrius CBS 109.77 TaxID=1314802 RepID=A0A6A6X1B5_9PLEO|nr:hypothetical protein K505DRAFT_365163 [Melanomma pulvis-pyrius CBS 109.77]
MVLSKRYCLEYTDGTVECFREGFWYTDKGIIIKWCILAGIFFFFMAWFVGGYMHARRRMRKGLPLLSYHRWLVPYNERKKWGQTPQNHFTFYATQPGYGPQSQQPHYAQRPDGTYPDAPPLYNGNDAPPGYSMPPGATKTNPNQHGVEMPQYGVPPPPPTYPMGAQQTGVVGGGYAQPDVENQNQQQQQQQQQHQSQDLPPRPQQAKLAFTSFVSRFKR